MGKGDLKLIPTAYKTKAKKNNPQSMFSTVKLIMVGFRKARERQLFRRYHHAQRGVDEVEPENSDFEEVNYTYPDIDDESEEEEPLWEDMNPDEGTKRGSLAGDNEIFP